MPWRCSQPGCTTRPSFGVAGSKKGGFCSKHATDGMVNVVNKRCSRPGCTKRPLFGMAGSKKVEFCSKHAKAEMVDVVNKKRCSQLGCTKQPSFGVDGSNRREFCSKHAADGMVDVVKRKKCSQPGCTTQPSFGVAGSNKVDFCSKHATDGMVHAVKKRCSQPGCTKHPSFGVEGSRTREVCAQHAEKGMPNVKRSKASSSGDARGAHGHGRGCSGPAEVDEGGTIRRACVGEKRTGSALSSAQIATLSDRSSWGVKRARLNVDPDVAPITTVQTAASSGRPTPAQGGPCSDPDAAVKNEMAVSCKLELTETSASGAASLAAAAAAAAAATVSRTHDGPSPLAELGSCLESDAVAKLEVVVSAPSKTIGSRGPSKR